MQTLLSTILQGVGATVDQDTSAQSGTELTVRCNFANRAQQDWALAYDWRVLRATTSPQISLSQASIGLPNRFDKLASPVWDWSTGVDAPTKYIEIAPQDRYLHLSTDKYCWILGDDAAGMSLQINPPLASGASISFDFKQVPSSLATPNDTVTCPSQQFIAERVTYYIQNARSDPRFPTTKQQSEDTLANLIEREDVPSGGRSNQVPSLFGRTGFRLGRDG